ncbi:MAG: AAA family ATPase [Desulfotalea sp.]
MLSNNKKVVLVFMGMVASGKSYLSEAIAKKERTPIFNSDVIRKEIAGLRSDSRQWLPVGDGIYSAEFSRRTYDEMFSRAEEALVSNDLVILDGSYSKKDERDLLLVRLQGKCEFLFVHCFCTQEVTYDRFAIRKNDDATASDGRALIFQHQLKTFELPTELPRKYLLQLDTDCDLADLIEICLREVAERKSSS